VPRGFVVGGAQVAILLWAQFLVVVPLAATVAALTRRALG